MKRDLIERYYGYGAARLRVSTPAPDPERAHSMREAWALALAELADEGWRHNLNAFAWRGGVVLLALFISLSIPVWLTLPSLLAEKNEPVTLALVRELPPDEALAEPEAVVARQAVVEPSFAEPRSEPRVNEPRPAAPAAPARPEIDPVIVNARAAQLEMPAVSQRAPVSSAPRSLQHEQSRPDVKAVALSAARRSVRVDAPTQAFRVPADLPGPRVARRGSARPAALSSSERGPERHVPQAPAAPVSLPSRAGAEPRVVARNAADIALPQPHVANGDAGIDGVPLDALAACKSDAEEDFLKQRVISAVEMRESCRSEMGTYRFLQMRNVNSFLLRVRRSPDREVLDRCGELRIALRCLENQPR